MSECPEPEGQVEVFPDLGTAHDVMLAEQGYCPWCGEES
jgi:hypothetical protein